VPLTDKDREYLESYDVAQFDRPSVAVDICVFSIVGGELAVLVVQRQEPPFEGLPTLPGGFVGLDESLEDAARRHLQDKAGISEIYLEQLYTFGAVPRDPRTRVISVAYVALVPASRLQLQPGVHPSRYGLVRVRTKCHPGRTTRTPVLEDALVDVDGTPVTLAFDHEQIIRTAITRVRGKLTYTTIGFQLVPETFTLTELQSTYEVVLARRLSKPAFRRKILDAELVEETGTLRRGGHRPAMLYRFVRGDAGGVL
jgi:8-oxo-dGTP diphosphatase